MKEAEVMEHGPKPLSEATARVFGLNVQLGRSPAVLRRLEIRLKKREIAGYTIAANVEKAAAMRSNRDLRRIVGKASFVVADGFPIAILATLKGFRITSRIDLPQSILALAARHQLSVYILGGTERVVQRAELKAREIFGCTVAGYHHGYFKNAEEQLNLLIKIRPDIVLVGLGSPRQEHFVELASKVLNCALLVPCGGALDILAGSKRRAPPLIRRLGMEWAFRMAQEPKRILRLAKKVIGTSR